MESHLWSTIFLVFLSYYIILQLIFNFKQRKSPQNYAKLPPSPPKLPVIGHLHLLSGGLLQHVLCGIAQKYGPVVHLQLGEIFSVVVSSPEATKQLMKEQDLACADKADRIGTRVMFYDSNDLNFSPYSTHWRQMRKIFVSQLLSARNVRSFGLIRQDEVSRLVLSLRSSASAVDLTEKTCALTCAIICRAVFGSVIGDVDVLKGLVNEAIPMITGYELVDVFPSSKLVNLLYWNKYKLRRMHHRVDAILERIVEEHRLKPSRGQFEGEEDIIDVMLRMEKDSHLQVPITRDAIKGFIFDAFAAGTESSTNTINWAMAELMRNPAAMAKAQTEIREALKGKTTMDVSDVQELKYLKSVVKETLRLHPPIPLILRQCREECEVNGYTIPKKTRITINVWSMGRDPTYWDEPEMFQPERFDDVSREFMGNDFEFIPFGAGRRICPALNFGVANVEIPLAQLLYHFDWKLPEGMDLANMDMTHGKGFTGTRENPLFLVPTPYTPSMETS